MFLKGLGSQGPMIVLEIDMESESASEIMEVLRFSILYLLAKFALENKLLPFP